MIVGLEYDNFQDKYNKCVVRLLGDDFNGIAFTFDERLQFTDCFNDLYKYLCRNSLDDMMGQKIGRTRWTVKFTRNQNNRTIELDDNSSPTTPGVVTRKYHSTITMEKVT